MKSTMVKVLFAGSIVALVGCKPTVEFDSDRLVLGSDEDFNLTWEVKPGGFQKEPITNILLENSRGETLYEKEIDLEAEPAEEPPFIDALHLDVPGYTTNEERFVTYTLTATNNKGETTSKSVEIEIDKPLTSVEFVSEDMKNCVMGFLAQTQPDIDFAHEVTLIATFSVDDTCSRANDPTGLENFENVERVDVRGTQVTNLNVIERQARLDTVSLEDNPLMTDLSFLEDSNALQQLTIKDMPITSIPELTFTPGGSVFLNINNTNMTDLSFLAGLTLEDNEAGAPGNMTLDLTGNTFDAGYEQAANSSIAAKTILFDNAAANGTEPAFTCDGLATMENSFKTVLAGCR